MMFYDIQNYKTGLSSSQDASLACVTIYLCSVVTSWCHDETPPDNNECEGCEQSARVLPNVTKYPFVSLGGKGLIFLHQENLSSKSEAESQ